MHEDDLPKGTRVVLDEFTGTVQRHNLERDGGVWVKWDHNGVTGLVRRRDLDQLTVIG